MPTALVLDDEQLAKGEASLDSDTKKLTASQVDDLVTQFRGYLGYLASNYPIQSTLEGLNDLDNSRQRCAKLGACLLLWQDDQFLNGGFSATNANRTGFNYSIDTTDYYIFRYCFGLFWDIPAELDNKFLSNGTSNRFSQQGRFIVEV